MAASLSLPPEIIPQLSQARTVLERHLAGTLQAIHLFGSAVDGGLKPHSDIDLMVTVGAPLAASVRQALMMDLLSVSGSPGAGAAWRPLEVTLVVRGEVVPWRYPPLRELQFGEWLREELQAGIVEPAMPDHDLAILLGKLRQHSICLLGPPADELFDAAAAWALERLPGEHRPVLASAHAAYLGRAPDNLADRPTQVAAFVRYTKALIVDMVCAGPAPAR